jgi:molybdate transport system substrate-binding protein
MIRRMLLAGGALLLCSGAVHADDVRVLAAGAAKFALERIAPQFERAHGHRLLATFDTVGAQRDRVLAAQPGAVADVVILSDEALRRLAAASRLADAAPVRIGVVAVSLAVKEGSAVPDLSTPGALRQALLAAKSIAYADPARGATAGTHFAKVLDALGVRESLAPRTTVLPFGVEVIEAVRAGRFELGVSQSSEIVQHEGVRLAGALPPPYALATGYAAALANATPAARELVQFLASPGARDAWRASGFLEAP